ncbi:MAG: autotransporter assembly complex family protein [Aestuariibacter sp.]
MEKQRFFATCICAILMGFGIAPAQAVTISPGKNIERALADNINAHLTVYPAPNDCIISQHYRKKLEAALQKALHGLGYYQYQIQTFEPNDTNSCDIWQLELQLEPRVTVSNTNLILLGEGKNDPILQSALASFPLQSGSPINHKDYEEGKSNLISTAILRGYLDFRFNQKQLTIHPQENKATITLHADTGKRYRFGQIQGDIEPELLNLVTDVQTFSPGDHYDANLLNVFTQQLKQTGYFEQVSLRPLLDARNADHVPLLLTVQQKPRHIVNFGVGYSSDTGARTTIGWQRPRLNIDGHSLETELFVSRPEQLASVNYKIPLKNPTKNFVTLQLGVKSTDDNDTRSDTISLAVKRHWAWSEKEWNSIGFLRYDQESFVQGGQDKQTTALLIPGITLSRLRSDGALNPAWGDRQIITFEGASDSLLSDINLGRITAQSRWLRSFGEHRVFWRADLGAIATNSFQEVPSSLRYFAGGDQSIRGFGYQSLAPQDESEQLIGGKYLYTSSIEYSYELNEKWRLAAFADVGNASDEFLKDPATGLGIGLHWSTIIGPIRFYLARGNSDTESTWRFHFAMGAAL